MKHYLPRFSWMQIACIAILALMCAPLVIAATSSAVMVPNSGYAITTAGVLGFTGMRFDAADDPADPGKASGGGIAEAIAAIEDKTMPVSQRLGVAIKALQGIDPTNQLAKVQADLQTATKSLGERDATIATLQGELEAAQNQITALQTDVADHEKAAAAAEQRAKDAEAKEQDLEKRGDAKAKEKLGTLGFPASRLPGESDKMSQADEDDGKPEAQIRKLTGNQRTRAALEFQKTGKLPDWVATALATQVN